MQRDYRVLIIFLWLIGLTIFQLYDIIKVKITKSMPPVMILEEIEVKYELPNSKIK